MFALHLSAVSFAYAGGAPLFEDIELHLGPGWTGLCGPNGAGKSTLLGLLSGALSPTAGPVRRDPAGLVVATCPQRVDVCTEAIRAFSWEWDKDAVLTRATLGLEPEALERWSTLSPGERKRWQLGAALAGRPGALLLDEPTNHLDVEGKARLVEALAGYDGVGVIVSHDRALLDALTTQTVFVGGGVEVIGAPYSEAAAQRAATRAAYVAEVTAAQDRARALRAQVADARRTQASTERQNSSGRRMDSRRDHDARSSARKFRVAKAEAAHSRKVGTLAGAAAAVEASVAGHGLKAEVGRSLFVDEAQAPVSPLAVVEAPTVRAGERVLLRDVRLVVERGARIRLAGPNGAGKTTLLDAVRAGLRIPAERCLWIGQHQPVEAGRAALDAVRALPPDERGRTLQLVAALGVDPDRLLASAEPSPGEARKLVLARGLAKAPWLVVLDEPTNHLDLPSIERLEAALGQWPGALLLVSHDDAFAAALCDRTWSIERRRVRVE